MYEKMPFLGPLRTTLQKEAGAPWGGGDKFLARKGVGSKNDGIKISKPAVNRPAPPPKTGERAIATNSRSGFFGVLGRSALTLGTFRFRATADTY